MKAELLNFFVFEEIIYFKGLQLSHTCPVYCHHQIYSLWDYESLSGPDPEKCISTGWFVVMGELLFPMGAFLWVTADHLRCWDSPSQTVTAPAVCWHLPMVAGVGSPPNPTAARWSTCSWFRTPECSCRSALWASWEFKKQNQSYKLLTGSFLSLVSWFILGDSSSHCCFWGNNPIPQNNHCAQSTPFPKSSWCVISNTILW